MRENIVIIDYGSGNLRSVAKAFEHVIAQQNLPFQVVVSDKARDIESAARIVLPGQGAFRDCMMNLKARDGVIDALNEAVLENKTPFLGICVGMQLLATKGYEHGETDGLNWIPGEVVAIEPPNPDFKVPHMGWNVLHCKNCDEQGNESDSRHPVLHSVTKTPRHFYFVHSFQYKSADEKSIIGYVEYGITIQAVVGKDNIIGVQFHPEKSQNDGLELIKNFLTWAR